MDATAICNLALGLVGEKPIGSIDDETRIAVLCSTNFAAARNAVLEGRDWTFATRRVEIAAAADAPVFGRAHQYPRDPSDLRVLEVSDGELELDDWVVEGRAILTDYAGPVLVKFIAQVEDTAQFSPAFCQALAAYLGYVLAVPLTENRSLKADLWQEYIARRKEAGSLDGVQGRTKKRMRASWSKAARY